MAPHFPDELLLYTFSYLINWNKNAREGDGVFGGLEERGQSTLAALCATCKRFRLIAEPMLYSIFIKPENVYDRLAPNSVLQSTRHEPNGVLRLYLRTLLDRPDLAAQVQTVQLRAWEIEERLDDDLFWAGVTVAPGEPVPPSLELARKFYQAATRLVSDLDSRLDWLICLCRGDEDAEIALLLALLPNVERLQIVFPNVGMDRYGIFFFHLIVQEALNPDRPTMHTFSRLKVLEARSYWMEEIDVGLPLYCFTHFFRLPCIEVFKAYHMIVDDPDEWGEWLCPLGVSKIRDLHLEKSIVSSEAVAKLMNSCKGLRSLYVTFPPNQPTAVVFAWPEISNALEHHTRSLQCLTVDLAEDTSTAPLNTLKYFDKLRDIELNQIALIGRSVSSQDDEHKATTEAELADMFPSSLESLTILDPTSAIDSSLERLSHSLVSLPRLRRIGIHGGDEYNPPRPLYASDEKRQRKERVRLIGELFKGAGIEWVEVYRDSYSEWYSEEDDDEW